LPAPAPSVPVLRRGKLQYAYGASFSIAARKRSICSR
jgi:hypothetical protein